jgi:hypothetical protein
VRYLATPVPNQAQTEAYNERTSHRAHSLRRAAERRAEGRQASITLSREVRRARAFDSLESDLTRSEAAAARTCGWA